jgi:hypothetical protein
MGGEGHAPFWQNFSYVLKAPPGVRLARRRDLTRTLRYAENVEPRAASLVAC